MFASQLTRQVIIQKQGLDRMIDLLVRYSFLTLQQALQPYFQHVLFSQFALFVSFQAFLYTGFMHVTQQCISGYTLHCFFILPDCFQKTAANFGGLL